MIELKIFVERCKGCGLCVNACPKSVLEMSKETNSNSYHYAQVVDAEKCVGCEGCYIICPDSCIEIY